MQKSVVIWVACVFFANLTLWAQCPDKTTLRQRIILLKESTKVPSSEKLTEMQRYLSAMNRCAYKNDSTHVSLLHFIGWLYNQQGDFAKAVEYRKQAITMVMTNAGSDKIKLTVMPAMYYWLSVSYDSVNLFKEKMAALDSCASIAIRLSQVDRASLTAVYTFIQYFFDIGDYKRCIDYTIKCQLMAKQYGNQTPAEQKVAESFASSSFGWQVIALIKLKNFSEAEKLLSNKVTEYQKAGATNYLGTTFSQLAELQLNKGDYAKALLYYKQALNYDQKAAYVFNCKQTLRDIGYAIYFNHYRARKKALNYYKKALSLVNKDKALYTADVFESLDIFAKIAAIHVREKNYDSAFYYYRVALNQIRPGGETAIVYNSSDEIIRYKKIHYLTRLLLDKGDALVQQHNDTKRTASLAEAVAVFKITDQLLDR